MISWKIEAPGGKVLSIEDRVLGLIVCWSSDQRNAVFFANKKSAEQMLAWLRKHNSEIFAFEDLLGSAAVISEGGQL